MRAAAYLRHDCGRCKVEMVEKGDAELRARPIGEWGGDQHGRVRRSSCNGNGDGGCCGGCAEAKEEVENEMGARDGVGECGACCSALWPIVATRGRVPTTHGFASGSTRRPKPAVGRPLKPVQFIHQRS